MNQLIESYLPSTDGHFPSKLTLSQLSIKKGALWICREDPIQGRFLVAQKNIQPGQLILDELPYAYVPMSKKNIPHDKFCFVCAKAVNIHAPFCSTCQQVWYCSVACQEMWRPAHDEYECKLYLALKDNTDKLTSDLNLLRFAFRVWILSQIERQLFEAEPCFTDCSISSLISAQKGLISKDGIAQQQQVLVNVQHNHENVAKMDSLCPCQPPLTPEPSSTQPVQTLSPSLDHLQLSCKKLSYIDSNPIRHYVRQSGSQFSDILALQGHEEEYDKLPWSVAIRTSLAFLVDYLPDHARQSPETLSILYSICTRINCNCHSIMRDNVTIGLGLYPTFSLMNHSCMPNSFFSTSSESPRMYCRAIQSIAKGEEISISYIDLYQTRLDRQKELLSTKFFSCTCQRCTEDCASDPCARDALVDALYCTSKSRKAPEICGGRIYALSSRTNPMQVKIEKAKSVDPIDHIEPVLEGDDYHFPKPLQRSTLNQNAHVLSQDNHQQDKSSTVEYKISCVSHLSSSLVIRELEKAKSLFEYAELHYKIMTPSSLEQAKNIFLDFLHRYTKFNVMPDVHTYSAGDKSPIGLGPDHFLVFTTHHRLFNCFTLLNNLFACSKHLKLLITSIEKILPLNDLELSNFYFFMGSIYKAIEANSAEWSKNAQRYRLEKKAAYQKSAKIRTIALGKENELTKLAKSHASSS